MKLNRIMLAAPKSGSGKTMMTCALLQSLKNMGKQVISFKCGPDYIDPMFHEQIIGVPSENLDTFFCSEEQIKALLFRNRKEGEIAVLEGVMGLYDGLGGVREEGSSYHLAKVTRTPIILVVDGKGMGRSLVALIAGFLSYDTESLIKGVILNRISKAYYDMIKPLIEAELHTTVFGFFPEQEELCVKSRYLGLLLPEEMSGIRKRLQAASVQFCQTISVESIMQIATQAEEVEMAEKRLPEKSDGDKPVIAVARDEAFCFYYTENLRLLQSYGAELCYFSPLHDKKLPEGCSALLLGGGYPELYGEQLSENIEMRSIIKRAAGEGMPVVAECGGFMYLHDKIFDKAGKGYDMAGVLPADCHGTERLVRFGYIELQEKKNRFLPEGGRIRGHEFHYFDSTNNGTDCIATKPVTKKEYSCMIVTEKWCLGYPHLYYPSNPAFAENFVRKARQYAVERKGE